MEEIWKDIEGYEGLYQVSNLGRIYSVPRVVNKNQKVGGQFITPSKPKCKNYFRVGLHKSGRQYLEILAHLVAKAFPEICGDWFAGCEVHHKNHNSLDNRAENLIVLTLEEHNKLHSNSEITYSKRSKSQVTAWKTRTKRVAWQKAVEQYDLQGNYINTYSSLKEAAKQTGTNIPAMSSCLNGKYKTAGGFKWKFAS